MNLIDGKLVVGPRRHGAAELRAALRGQRRQRQRNGAAATTDGRPLTFGIRPEDVVVEPGAPVEATVHDVENHGVEKILTLRVGDATILRATVSARTNLAIDETVTFSWNPDKVVLFDHQTGKNLAHA